LPSRILKYSPGMQRETPSTQLPLGSTLPHFNLPDVTEKNFDSAALLGAKAALVVFTCNHCPYVKGSEEMLISTLRRALPLGLKAVLISSNDANQYPEDGFEMMKIKSKESALPVPYLYDESQVVAKLFDAACTPECYLFDSAGKLAYHGTINDAPKDKTKASKNFLGTAIDQLLRAENPNPSYVHPLGCSIKWKPAK